MQKKLFKGLEIPNKFQKNGYNYVLIHNVLNYALYEQNKIRNGKRYTDGYKIHKLRCMKECIRKFKLLDGSIREVTTPNQINMPGNEKFGHYAWSYQTKEVALKEFNRLIGGKNYGIS